LDHLDLRNSRAAGNPSPHNREFYFDYKDRLALLEQIENLECFAVPNLRAKYQEQAILMQKGKGNLQKAKALAQDLASAEQVMARLKTRLKSI
jgi:hypothetical protein